MTGRAQMQLKQLRTHMEMKTDSQIFAAVRATSNLAIGEQFLAVAIEILKERHPETFESIYLSKLLPSTH